MNKWLVGAVMILATGLFITVKCCRNPVPDDSLLVKRSTIDSINAIAKSIPDTVYRTDTIYTKPIIKWYSKIEPVKGKDSVTRDSLKTDDIKIYVTDSASIRKIGYELFAPKIITNTIEITKKIPFYIVSPPIEIKKWYTMGGIGNGVSVEVGRTIKKVDYGVQFVRFDLKNCFLIKAGIRF